MKEYIYADNAATTKLDIAAFEAMKPFLLDEYGNASQPYSFGRNAKKALIKAREMIAECIGALPEEIFFTSGGSESNNWVIKGSALADPEKKTTITSSIEHQALLHSCKSIERLGYPVVYLPVSFSGQILPDTLESVITNHTRLVSIMYSNNEIGTLQPIHDLARIAHSHGALFHTDAVQAVGHVKINVHELDIDFLSASAHKFNGPKGVGFLYIRKGVLLDAFIDGGAQENGLRAGTENIAGIVGMAVALSNNCANIEQNSTHLRALENQLLALLQNGSLDFIRNGGDETIPGNISLSFKNADGEAILHRLDLIGISVSTGSACDSINTQVSHVLKAIALDDSYAKGTIRVSLGKNNTVEDVTRIANALVKICTH